MPKKIYNKNIIGLGVTEYDFPQSLVEKINNIIDKSDKLSWTNSGINGNAINTKIRSSSEMTIESQDAILNEKIKKFIKICVEDYSKDFNIETNADEVKLIILRYKSGSEYKYHQDNGPNFYRTVSMLIYLNPDKYDGGETDFKFLNLKVKPESPKLVLFPSNYIYTHAALPVTNGIKYVIVGWMNDII